MRAFSTKYALALYEAVARRVRLQHIFYGRIPLDAFRELLGVPEGKLKTFGNLNQYAIKPAVTEINAMANFGVKIMPNKQCRWVISVTVGWWQKDIDDLKSAYAEVRRPKVGRKARIADKVEEVVSVQISLPV